MNVNPSKKTAVITGASGGIGSSIAIRFASEGFNIVCVDIPESNYAQLLDKIEKAGGQCIFIETDVTSSEDVNNMVNQAVEVFGAIDVLVNSAGIGIRSPFLEITEEEWDKTIAVNLKGTFLCTQKVAASMVSMKIQGTIVNISSICGEVADRFSKHAHYEASKGGVNMLTKAAAMELADNGIRVNAVAPGRIQTPLLNKDPEHVRRVSSFIPLGRYGKPEDVAASVFFLASDEAKYITGTVLYVDGGWTLQ
jgi:NAD(P)-dependent dehydrogenase (short-subunit alcohol dehydrogenase family)